MRKKLGDRAGSGQPRPDLPGLREGNRDRLQFCSSGRRGRSEDAPRLQAAEVRGAPTGPGAQRRVGAERGRGRPSRRSGPAAPRPPARPAGRAQGGAEPPQPLALRPPRTSGTWVSRVRRAPGATPNPCPHSCSRSSTRPRAPHPTRTSASRILRLCPPGPRDRAGRGRPGGLHFPVRPARSDS